MRPATTPKSGSIPHSLSNHSPSPVALAPLPQTSRQPEPWLFLLGHCHWYGVKDLMVSAKQINRWRWTPAWAFMPRSFMQDAPW